MPRPSRYWTWKCQQQWECEQVMEGGDDERFCRCGFNGDHSELERYMDEEPERFNRNVLGF